MSNRMLWVKFTTWVGKVWTSLKQGVGVVAVDGVWEGALRLRSLDPSQKLLVGLAAVLVGAFLLMMALAEWLRQTYPRLGLPHLPMDERLLQAPIFVVPLSLASLALAWTYLLTGALRAWWPLRWLFLSAFVIQIALVVVQAPMNYLRLAPGVLLPVLAGIALLGLVLVYIILSLRQTPESAAFPLIGAFIGAVFIFGMLALHQAEQRTNLALTTQLIAAMVSLALLLSIPYLLLAGIEMVDFALSVARWGVATTRAIVPSRVLIVVLFLVLVARLGQLAYLGLTEPYRWSWGAWAGAAFFCAGLALIGQWRRWRPAGDAVTVPTIFIIALLVGGLVLLQPIISLALALIVVALNQIGAAASITDRLFAAIDLGVTWLTQQRPLLIASIGLVLAVANLRRRPALAVLGLILAWDSALYWALSFWLEFQPFRFTTWEIDGVVLLALCVLACRWQWQGTLRVERALGLLSAALLFWLLGNTGFLDNPFTPLFASAGMGFIVFALAWSIVCAGKVANGESKRFPRASRVLMYLGGALLTVTVIHWYVATYDVVQLLAQSSWTQAEGLLTYGMPLAYLALVEGCERLRQAED